MKKGILIEKRPGTRLYIVIPEGDEYYEDAKKRGKEILYLDKRVSREEFKKLMKQGMKYIPATVLDPNFKGEIVYYLPVEK